MKRRKKRKRGRAVEIERGRKTRPNRHVVADSLFQQLVMIRRKMRRMTKKSMAQKGKKLLKLLILLYAHHEHISVVSERNRHLNLDCSYGYED